MCNTLIFNLEIQINLIDLIIGLIRFTSIYLLSRAFIENLYNFFSHKNKYKENSFWASMLCIVLFDWVLLNSNSKLNSNSCDQKIKRVFFLPFSPFSLLVHLSFSPFLTAHIRPGRSSFPFSFFSSAQFPAHFPRLAHYHASPFSLADRRAPLASSLFLPARDSGSSLS